MRLELTQFARLIRQIYLDFLFGSIQLARTVRISLARRSVVSSNPDQICELQICLTRAGSLIQWSPVGFD